MGKSKIIYQYDPNGNYIDSFRSIADAADYFNGDESTIRKRIDTLKQAFGFYWSTTQSDKFILLSEDNETIAKHLIRAEKEIQKMKDKRRIDGNDFKKAVRLENAIEEVYKELVNNFNNVTWTYSSDEFKKNIPSSDTKMIIQLSDLHLDELVDNSIAKFDISVASARLKKFADEAIKLAEAYNINTVLIAMTGDIVSSDKLLDQMLSKAANRAVASLVATKLLATFISYISENIGQVFVIGVVGNESRAADKMPYVDAAITDNYDYLIYNQLRLLLDNRVIKFIQTDVFEAVVNVNGLNILFLHGYNLKNDDQKYFQSIMGKYAQNNIRVDFIMFGHVHYSMITDISARSSSLVGNNEYAFRALNLSGRASQNIHIVKEDGSMNNIRVDLTEYDENDLFPIEEFLDMYRESFSDRAKAVFNRRFFVVELDK